MSPAWALLSPPVATTRTPGPEALNILLQSCAAAEAQVRVSMFSSFPLNKSVHHTRACSFQVLSVTSQFSLSSIVVLAACMPLMARQSLPCSPCRGHGSPQSCLHKGKAAEQRASGSSAAAGKQCEAATALEACAESSPGSQPPRYAAQDLPCR